MSERLSQNSGTEAMTAAASEEIRPRAAQQAPHGDAMERPSTPQENKLGKPEKPMDRVLLNTGSISGMNAAVTLRNHRCHTIV